MISMPTLLSIVLCVACMASLYRRSGDLLDFRAALFVAVLLFLLTPAATIDVQLSGSAFYWSSDLVRSLIITEAEMQRVEIIVLLGLIAIAIPILLRNRSLFRSGRQRHEVVPGPRIWLIYAAAMSATVALALLQYGGLFRMLVYMVSPDIRAASTLQLYGLSSLLLFLSSITAYYAAQRFSSRAMRLVLFTPILFLVLPAGNRGSMLSVGLIAAAAAYELAPRRPLRVALLGTVLLPPFASMMFQLRQLAVVAGTREFSIFGMYVDFTRESFMLPTFAYALRALRARSIDYAYGTDLLLFPLWYVPRMLWAAKPLPLDFRLNAALGLNDGDVFGTPVSLFGGLYLNFTWLGYLPVCAALGLLVAWSYERWEYDRMVKLLMLTFIIDLVRVGDLSREMVTVSLGFAVVWMLRRMVMREAAPVLVPATA